jgi:hypothetical protein
MLLTTLLVPLGFPLRRRVTIDLLQQASAEFKRRELSRSFLGKPNDYEEHKAMAEFEQEMIERGAALCATGDQEEEGAPAPAPVPVPASVVAELVR